MTQAMLDPDRGIAPMIAGTNYSVKEPASSYQPWAEGVCRCYRIFQEQVAASGLPPEIQKQVRRLEGVATKAGVGMPKEDC